jgi:hypothetical protein
MGTPTLNSARHCQASLGSTEVDSNVRTLTDYSNEIKTHTCYNILVDTLYALDTNTVPSDHDIRTRISMGKPQNLC